MGQEWRARQRRTYKEGEGQELIGAVGFQVRGLRLGVGEVCRVLGFWSASGMERWRRKNRNNGAPGGGFSTDS